MKNFTVLLILSTLLNFGLQAQEPVLASIDTPINAILETSEEAEQATAAAVAAEWLNVNRLVVQDLQAQTVYPGLAQQFEIEGTVKIQFTFDGELKDVKVIQSVPGGCDMAALTALQNLPEYYRAHGTPLPTGVKLEMPFKFEL